MSSELNEILKGNFPARLEALRKKKGLKLRQVAEATGLHFSTINNFENRQRPPSLDAIITLARFFDVSIDYLLGLDDLQSVSDAEIKICLAIKNQRERMGCTETEFASLLELTREEYGSIEHGTLPSREILLKVSMHAALSLEELTGFSEQEIDRIYRQRLAREFAGDSENTEYIMLAMRIKREGLRPDEVVVGKKI